MNINRKISKYNFNKGSVSRIKYIVIHYVGALGGAEDNCRYYGGGNRNASAHYFVGFNGEVWQCVEDANIAWHCGASSYKHAECRNANSIGIEMCVRKKNTKSMGATDKDWYFEDATVEAAAELTRYLMNKYGVPASHVIRHYDVTGKICPNPYVYNTSAHTWDEFKRKISGQAETPQGGNEKTIWNFLTGKGLNAYAVAGIMGNLYAESGLMPNNLQNTYNNKLGKTDAEYTAAVDNGSYGNFVKDSAGYGLAQWTYWSRKQALLNHAKQAGVSIADLAFISFSVVSMLCPSLWVYLYVFLRIVALYARSFYGIDKTARFIQSHCLCLCSLCLYQHISTSFKHFGDCLNCSRLSPAESVYNIFQPDCVKLSHAYTSFLWRKSVSVSSMVSVPVS